MKDLRVEYVQLTRHAELMADRGRWGREAELVNLRLIDLNPHAIDARTRLARCYAEAGNLEGAIALYQQVLRLEPNNQEAVRHLSDVERKRACQAVAESVTSAEEAQRQGLQARDDGESELAVAYLERAVSLNPDTASRIALAAAYRSVRRLDAAESSYRQVLAESFQRAAAVGLGEVLHDRGELAEAKHVAEAVLKVDPTDHNALHLLEEIETDSHKVGRLSSRSRVRSMND